MVVAIEPQFPGSIPVDFSWETSAGIFEFGATIPFQKFLVDKKPATGGHFEQLSRKRIIIETSN